MPRYLPDKAATRAAFAAFVLLALSPAAPAADPDAVARGRYLAAGAGCDQCHTDTEHGGQPYAGGRLLVTAFGTIPTPNITPDKETGIGRWSSGDFVRAMRWGIAPDDSHYVPLFPYLFYNRLTDGDLDDLKAFLDSLAPVARPDLKGAGSTALVERAQAALAVVATPLAGPWKPAPDKDEVWNRGAYLVAGIGRCSDCHTPRTWLGAPDPDRFLAGNTAGPKEKKAPNITPDPETGIGNWIEADVIGVLTDGRTPDFEFVGGPMAEIVKSTARLTDGDRLAIAVYLRSVPPKPSPEKR
jgi:mono/diheme cytochrome c family protein